MAGFDVSSVPLNLTCALRLPRVVIVLVITCQVCNHPELFERNEGQSSVHFAAVPHSLPPPPFGELEDVHYAGGLNPVSFKVLVLFLKIVQFFFELIIRDFSS